MQDSRRQKQCKHGIYIAQDRNGLRPEPLHTAEIQRVGNARVNNTDKQNKADIRRRERKLGHALGDEDIRYHNERRARKLDDGLCVNVLDHDLFVQDNDRCVKYRRAEAEDYPPNVLHLSRAAA